ncbi:hypothetical protein [Myxococcus sp. SDU36]|uniref:hypothetical protein n=1 Tax=Myxococcus sp. SDU36 TaxID=2831967 RepID=UPI002543783D|nr:hypothetical protein [Myxococcus sp. SDU36]
MLRLVTIIALLATPPTFANEEVVGSASFAERGPVLSPEEALEQYELRHIGFDEFVTVSLTFSPLALFGPPRWWTVAYEGKFKKPLKGEAFYRKLGRDDLLAEYQARSTMNLTLKLVGGVATVGGLTYVIAAAASLPDYCPSGPDFASCTRRKSAAEERMRTKFWVGSSVSMIGAGLLMWGVLRDPHPITPSEARELADGHNKRLRQELGLTGGPTPAPRARPNVIQARVTPVLGPHTGGLMVEGTF